MDEESLQAALLGDAAAEAPSTTKVPDLSGNADNGTDTDPSFVTKNSSISSTTPMNRSQLSSQSKLRRLLYAFRTMSAPYFRESREGKCLFGLLFVIILVSCAGKVYLSYQVNYFYSALVDKDIEKFWEVMLVFAIAMVCFVPVDVAYAFVQIRLNIAWRKWLTKRALKLYFHNKAYYSLERKSPTRPMTLDESIDYYDAAANKKTKQVDNPDQRIQEDVNSFTTYSLSYFSVIVESFVDLISFSILLGSIMPELFIGLILFASFGTILTIIIGKQLVRLNFENLQREADFRFSLVRVRENAESIAFYSGERVEEKETDRRLLRVIDNSSLINMAQMRLNFFTISYNRLTWILPLMIVAPEYFAGIVEFGVVQQARVAFDHILGDLSLVISEFTSIAQFSAGIERLYSFLNAMQEIDGDRTKGDDTFLQDPGCGDDNTHVETDTPTISESFSTAITVKDIELPASSSLVHADILVISNLQLATPDNKRVLLQNLNLSLPEGKNLLIVGVSGAGKSSLLRAVAGLWSTGDGLISRPNKEHICFLPQRPYCPPGTLRDQLLYPSTILNDDGSPDSATQSRPNPRDWDDAALLSVLVLVDLPDLASRSGDGDPIRGLNSILDWSNTLSLGEQQRLAFARIVTNRPRLVIMDESTSALDVKSENKMYALLKELPLEAEGASNMGSTYISVGHRPTLLAYHDIKLAIKDGVGVVSEIQNSFVVDEDFLLG
eukprot:CCRYP_014810-RA/>CCRYP_014810-RA protein AED:0.30 eAED:0.29 QI:0/0/0/1/1/1/2/0/724